MKKEKLKEEVNITTADLEKYPYYTKSSILSIKIISKKSTRSLKKLLLDDASRERLRLKLGSEVNPNWVVLQIAEVLHERDAITDEEFCQLTD